MATILLSNLSFCYEGSYQPVFEDLSIALDTDWHLGLTGRNGRGKTTLLRLLLGAQGEAYGLRGFTGSIQTKVRFGYFPAPVEHPEWLALEVAQAKSARIVSSGSWSGSFLCWNFQRMRCGVRLSSCLAEKRPSYSWLRCFCQENAFPLDRRTDQPPGHRIPTAGGGLWERAEGIFAGVPRPRFSGWVCRPYPFARPGWHPAAQRGFCQRRTGLSDEGAVGKGAERTA